MKKLILIATVFCSNTVWAVNSYDPVTNVLKLDTVVVNDTQFNTVEVKLGEIQVLKVGASAPYSNVTETCAAGNFTLERYNAIAKGMSLNQVKQTIGCNFNAGLTLAGGSSIQHSWTVGNNKFITVIFDQTDSFVVSDEVYKVRAGF